MDHYAKRLSFLHRSWNCEYPYSLKVQKLHHQRAYDDCFQETEP